MNVISARARPGSKGDAIRDTSEQFSIISWFIDHDERLRGFDSELLG